MRGFVHIPCNLNGDGSQRHALHRPLLYSKANQTKKKKIPGNLDFENLSQMLFNVWNDFGRDTDNYLNQTQLEIVCERVGLQKVGKKVAGEVFEKLGLNPNNRIGYNEFIALLHSDSDVSTLDECPIDATTDTSCVGPLDESSGYDLHAHTGLL